MKRQLVAVVLFLIVAHGVASADESDPVTDGRADTITDAVRVTILKSGGENVVRSVTGGAAGARQGCSWSLVFAPELEDTPYGTSPGARPDPEARFALLLCNGQIVQPIWVAPTDIVDLDAVARDMAQRYIEDVLEPAVSIGVNPSAHGLAGLRSWFWVDGFDGTVTAPPITAFGLTIEVRMSSRSVTWDFGDGETLQGDLGRAYPDESTVQHAHQRHGEYTITATIDLAPEYRVNGGGWLTLPDLQAIATTQHEVEQRQAVITDT